MALWDRITTMLAIRPHFDGVTNLQTRTIEGMDLGSSSLDDLLSRVQGGSARPWRAASIREALGVPAIFGAVNLIANVTGSLSFRALRNEIELAPADRPRLIVRPDPFTIPREFYRSTAYNLASRGETWWYVGVRDGDGMALSLLNVNPADVTVEENPDDLRYPIIEWRGVRMKNEDFRQLVYAKEPGSLRGHGPLQMCGAAVSVAVESQEFAANYYHGGGTPPLVIKAAGELGSNPDFPDALSEAQALRAQWMDQDPNTPRVIDAGIEDIDYPPQNAQGAQMLEARAHQNIDVATMFNMDAPLLNAAVAGSSLTYQNVGMEFEKFLRQCLRPNYLEVIEQTMSDFLPRSIVARANTAALTLADIKTRYDVYGVGIDKGIIDAEEARSFEGLAPGDVENAAVPFSPPQAIPTQLPIQMRAEQIIAATEVRCDGRRMLRGILAPCNKLLGMGTFSGACPRCKKAHDIKPVQLTHAVQPVAVTPVVIPLMRTVATVAVPSVEEAIPEPPSEMSLLRDLMESLPDKIAAAMPRQEQPPVVNFHEGAFRSDSPVVNVPAPVVNIHEGAFRAEAPVVNMTVQPAEAPVVHIAAPEPTRIDVHIPEPKPTRKRIERDAEGRPVAVIEESA